ncbi:MAG: peptidoglycan DD-metalloendopeptidase family protein [Bacteroidales bacterium]|nr:peptidoglycan DD-metalloendopeptidase family protein [Candidatus Sodaliphilus aphodohippi]
MRVRTAISAFIAIAAIATSNTVGATSDHEQAIAALNDITSLLTRQEHDIVQLEAQLTSLKSRQQDIEADITRQKGHLAALRSQYAAVVRNINTHSSATDRLAFIFAASSFHQAWQRAVHIWQLSQWRKEKSQGITASLASLSNKQDSLNSLTTLKRTRLEACNTNRITLMEKYRTAMNLVSQMNDKNLTAAVNDKGRRIGHLDREYERIATSATSNDAPEPVDMEAMRNSLPYPVLGKHSIAIGFGRQHYPNAERIMFYNNGIDINCLDRHPVAVAVERGQVSAIYCLPDNSNMVIVRHGEYMSVYGNLATIMVKKGQRVEQLQQLGEIGISPINNRHSLHFELRHEQKACNPEEYLKQ